MPWTLSSNNADTCAKALLFLDSVTQKDSNNFEAYNYKLIFLGGFSNKFIFLGNAKQAKRAMTPINEIIRLQPNVNYWFTLRGYIYEKTGDSIAEKMDFEKSLSICNQVLDTMSKMNQNYFMYVTNKAINLIMLNNSADANNILKTLYENYNSNSECDELNKEYILSLMNKNKKQLMETPLPGKDSETHIYLNQQ